MNEEEFKVVEAMEKFGGSFVKSLAQCFYRADRNNIDKLKNTFNEITTKKKGGIITWGDLF